MLTPADIQTQLKAMVRQAFPGEPVYEERCPEGFERPCTLLVMEKAEIDTQLAGRLAEVKCTFVLTTFAATDDYHYSHLAELHRRQMLLTGLFMADHIRVAGRAPHVRGPLKLAGGYDYDTVSVTFAYTVDKSEFMDLAAAPAAEHLSVAVHIEKE